MMIFYQTRKTSPESHHKSNDLQTFHDYLDQDLKTELANIEDNIRDKKAVLKITDQTLMEVDLSEKQIDAFKQDLSKNLFGKTLLKPDDLDRFKVLLYR